MDDHSRPLEVATLEEVQARFAALRSKPHRAKRIPHDSATSIKRLMRYRFGAPTKTAKKLFPRKDSKKEKP